MSEHQELKRPSIWDFPNTPRPSLRGVVEAIFPLFGEMLPIRKVRGVRLKDGRLLLADDRHGFVLYAYDGVQEEDDGGATLYGWEDIQEIIV